MTPYYVADVLFRIVEERDKNVKMANVFYIEYLGMLNHYGALNEDQLKMWKAIQKKHKVAALQG